MRRKTPIQLGVNVDHVATLRQARLTPYPDPLHAAFLAEQAGADGITAHLREDRRHIQDRDIELLAERLKTRLNLEMAVTDEMVEIACRIRPGACCLVPERREELTTEGGLDVVGHFDRIERAFQKLKASGIEVSLFIDPVKAQIEAAKAIGVPVVELHTGAYAEAKGEAQRERLEELKQAAAYASGLGLQVNAGHGLNYHNVAEVARIPEIVEFNIGHAIICHALYVGFPEAVRQMKEILIRSRLEVQLEGRD